MPEPRARFDPRSYRSPRPFAPLIRALGPVNRVCILRGLMKLRHLELPASDLARLRAAVDPRTAAFLGPNHPEFTTDWMLDKELSRRCSPLMAHWASYEIVNGSPLAQRFWLANNLIANAPGGEGKRDSVRWALAGHGVLLHPEGTATWQAERVGPLLPGIVEMAETAAHEAPRGRDVFIVPIVWKLRFTGDAGAALVNELALIERSLGLPASRGALALRFAALHGALLARQCAKLGLPAPPCDPLAPGRDYFAAQAACIAALRAALEARYGALEPELMRAQHRLRRAFRERVEREPDAVALDRRRLAELQRLTGFDPQLYDRATLTQEQIAERLKHVRSAVLTRGMRHTLHNLMPIAAAPRHVAIRVPEPLHVAPGDGVPTEARLAQLHAAMQSALDALLAAQEGAVAPLRRANPLHSQG